MAKIVAFLAIAAMSVEAGSPVQKVVELLVQCKAKVLADLEEETKGMQEFSAYCDSEAKEKSYGIKTAKGTIQDLEAVIDDCTANIGAADDEISTLGTFISNKERELSGAQAVREEDHANFLAAEKELIETVDQLGRAARVLKKGMSLAQMRGTTFRVNNETQVAIKALEDIVLSQWVSAGSRKTLQSFLQARATAEQEEDDDLSIKQPQGDAYESSSGSIVQTVEDMQGKAEDSLTELRKKEMEASHGFELVKTGLMDEIDNNKAKLSATSKQKTDAEQKLEEANGQMVETKKSKVADEESLETLKAECQQKAVEYEEMMKDGKAEVGAIDKAKTILEEGVTAASFIQMKSRTRRSSDIVDDFDDDESDEIAERRAKVVDIFKGLANTRHSYVFSQLASMASADPFEKIKGLINDMIEKLLKKAQEEATTEAFCQEEMSKAKKSLANKEAKLDKFTSRVDEAEAKIAELQQGIKSLEGEVTEIDKATSEATKIRLEEHDEFVKVAKDYKDSAAAVAQAIEVLQDYYNGASFVQLKMQTSSRSKTKARARSSESGGGDAAAVIIGVLEAAQEDFTNLLAEAEAAETEAQAAFDKMATENKISKATKQTETNSLSSEMKSLQASLEMSKEDQASTQKELDSVLAYLDKLKPQCETKAMSYAEKKAAREAEIEGLKEALDILSGKGIPAASLMQIGSSLRRIRA